jgi:hypothetical protein
MSHTSVYEDEDFLLEGTGTVAGTVWTDVNGNGAHDSPEVGKAGVAVSLSGKRSTTTDADGNYSFANAVPGPGTVDVTAPSGFGVIGSASRAINLQNPDYSATGQDFFVQQLGSISGSVRDDTNGSGTLDPGEAGVGGVSIGLDTNGDQVADTTTATNTGGAYSFPNLAPRNYRVILNVPFGYDNTGPATIETDVAAGGDSPLSPFFIRRTQPFPGVSILTKKTKLDKKRRARIKVACPAAISLQKDTCSTTTTLKRKGKTLGSASATIGAGQTLTMKVRLSKKLAKLVARKRKLKVKAIAVATDGRTPVETSRKVTLRPRKKKKH